MRLEGTQDAVFATNGASAVEVYSRDNDLLCWFTIWNAGDEDGYYSLDGGTTWAPLFARSIYQPRARIFVQTVHIKRAGSSDMSKVGVTIEPISIPA